MKKVVPLLIYFASMILSWKFCAGYWVVGPVFAAALLLIHLINGKKLSSKHLIFTVISTLVYALVFWMADKGWRFKNEWADMFAGSLTAGVVVGTFLMTSLHSYFFGTDAKKAHATALAMILSWYVIIGLSGIHEALDLKIHISYSLLAIAFWQGIYFRRLKLS